MTPPRIMSGIAMIEFRVYGELVAKQSTKFFRNKKTGMMNQYTPAKIKRWQERVRSAAIPHRPNRLLSGPLGAEYTFYFIRPKSKTFKKKANPKYKDTKPDVENLVKGVNDAMEKIIFANDAQIADARIIKVYSDAQEYVNIKIWELT